MTKPPLPKDFLAKLSAITNKRPRIVIDHILKHGHITTEELKEKYGYDHPPRAARDVREAGVPLETFRLPDSSGKSIGAYRFADPASARFGRLAGRSVFSKEFKRSLVASQGERCAVCAENYDERYLQIDHRVPYEVAGDLVVASQNAVDFQLLCGSCNRAKSWSCESCENWKVKRDVAVCADCYWGNIQQYNHIAMLALRRVDLVWKGNETAIYDELRRRANQASVELSTHLKAVLRNAVKPPGCK